MKKQITILIISVIVLSLLFLIIKPSFVGNVVANEKVKLGYCPTMQEEAEQISIENNYELIGFGSAFEVLLKLKNSQIDKAIIGRKAEQSEINSETKETVLESGYTLVSNKKGFISDSELSSIKIYTYVSNKIVLDLMPANLKIIYSNKNEVLKKITEEKIALIPWEDWDDDFELVVVVEANKKAKDFRGVFLYEN